MEQEKSTNKADVSSLSGKYLTFKLGGETYGIQILKVQEIIGLMNITTVPRTPDFVRGVINLRGKVIPVIELRKKFNMESTEDTDHTCIIVVQVTGQNGLITMGVLVDEVSEVVDITGDQLEPAPSFGTNIDTAFILAMGKLGDSVVILLDIDKVLTASELSSISSF